MTQEPLIILAQFAKDFEEAPTEFGKGTVGLAEFYKCINQLARGFLCEVDFTKVLQNLSDVPEPVRTLIDYTQRAFALQQPPILMQEPLEKLEKLCADPQFRFLLESKALAREARKWLTYLKLLPRQTLKPADIKLDLSASLDLDEQEEGEMVSGRYVRIPLIILNEGLLPAEDVELVVKPKKGNPVLKTSFEQLPDQSQIIKLPFGIGAGQSQFYDEIELDYSEESEIEIRPEFVDFLTRTASEPRKPNSGSLTIKLPNSTHTSEVDLKNLYIPDLPLTSQDDWNGLMKGGHCKIIDKIFEKLNANRERGHLCFIHGIRRTGKTSVLHQLRRRLKDTGNYLSVYVDIHLWWNALHKRSIEEKGKSINGRELLYELAVVAAKEASRSNEEKQSMPFIESLNPFKDSLSMEYHDFDDFIGKLSQNSGKSVVFLLDELDSWFHVKEFDEDAQSLLRHFSSLAGRGICSAIMAHNWKDQEWEKQFLDDDITPLYEHLKFLEKQNIIELFDLIKLPYSQIALEFVWRFTGGWPSLVQLLLYRLVEEIKQQVNEKILIDVNIVKKVVKNILDSSDNHPFIRYYLKSFESAEIKVLEVLIKTESIQKKSSYLDGIQISHDKNFKVSKKIQSKLDLTNQKLNETLCTLLGKEIIEPVFGENEMCRLRVGLLSYTQVFELYSR